MILSVPIEPNMFSVIASLAVFVLTFFFIITEKLPNSVAAILGGALVIIIHLLTQDEAVDFIDFDTIGLLCGMMLTVAVMRKTGLFEYIAIKGIKLTKGNPWKMLIMLAMVTAVLSAFLDNVTTVLIIVPLTFAVTDAIKLNPMPFLISEILFSNIGGALTLIGDPPNIMIGGATHLTFTDFIINNFPIILIVGFVTFRILKVLYYKKLMAFEIEEGKVEAFDEKRTIQDKRFLWISLTVFILVILSFITHNMHHINLATLALGGGFLMMMVTKQDPEKVLKEVEWPTLFFFIGLFVIVGALEKSGVIGFIADSIMKSTGGDLDIAMQLIVWLSAVASSFIDNIPFTATMISVIKDMAALTDQNIDQLWWALSLGACLGGNGTLIGASANIIVAGFSQKTPYPINFKAYFKVGFPLMLVSIVLVSVYLYVKYSVF